MGRRGGGYGCHMKRRHTREELRELLGAVEDDASELVARRALRPSAPVAPPAQAANERFVIWSAARAEANLTYDDWCSAPGTERYLVYRAAEDRADAAEAALAQGARLAA